MGNQSPTIALIKQTIFVSTRIGGSADAVKMKTACGNAGAGQTGFQKVVKLRYNISADWLLSWGSSQTHYGGSVPGNAGHISQVVTHTHALQCSDEVAISYPTWVDERPRHCRQAISGPRRVVEISAAHTHVPASGFMRRMPSSRNTGSVMPTRNDSVV